MARLPLVDVETAEPELRTVFERARQAQGQVSNLYRTLANQPSMLNAWIGMAWPLRSDARTPRGLRELMIMRVAQLCQARYEWAHHWRLALANGVSEEKLRGLRGWRESTDFDEVERAALAFTDELAESIAVSDATYAGLAEHFDAPAMVELTLTASFYCHVSRALRTLDVDLEPGFDGPLEDL